MKLQLTDRAKDDVELAFAWYERQRKGLGFEFLGCLDVAMKALVVTPKICGIRYSVFRACVIRRFPFSVFYTLESNKIIVHSVFDNRQDPKKRP
ncbi:MAG: type II toxin-antitoxin system RelE/ParE family toxin [Gammaproteobacteria bacterium]|nr:type II toxin-antitoxin system RelE/ParE family toxin [Gammaproteobacteria bacterium]